MRRERPTEQWLLGTKRWSWEVKFWEGLLNTDCRAQDLRHFTETSVSQVTSDLQRCLPPHWAPLKPSRATTDCNWRGTLRGEEAAWRECCGRYDTAVWGRCSNSKCVFDMGDRNDGSHVSLRRSVGDVNKGNGISDGKSISTLIPNDCQGFCECRGTLWSMIQWQRQLGRNTTSSISRIFKFFHYISQKQIPSVWRITVQPYKRGVGACAGRNTENYFWRTERFLAHDTRWRTGTPHTLNE